MKNHFPNILTSLNLFSGCIAAVMVFKNHLDIAGYFVFIAAFFDLLDGMVARKVDANSAFGKELDSLADVVSFGFVPGAIMYKMLQSADLFTYFPNEYVRRFIQFVPFVITIFAALRLARFNIDTRQTTSFLGVPVPANSLLIVSFPLMIHQFPGKFEAVVLHPYFILPMCIVSSLLMVSEIPLFALKFKTTRWKENKFQYILVLLILILVPFLRFAAIPILFVCYVLLSIIDKKMQPALS